MPHRFILSTGRLCSLTWVSVITLREISTTGVTGTKTCFGVCVRSCNGWGSVHCVRDGQHGAEYDSPLRAGRWPLRVPPPPDPWPFARDGGAAAARTAVRRDKHTGQERKKTFIFEKWIDYIQEVDFLQHLKTEKLSFHTLHLCMKKGKNCVQHLTVSLCRFIANMEKNMERKRIQTLATSSTYLPETWQTSHLKANGPSSQHPAPSPVDQVSNC